MEALSANSDYIIITLTALSIALSCSLLGSYLTLKKQSMMGDAISHAILPGIVIAFLITGKFTGMAFTVGALAAALLTSFCIEFLRTRVRVNEETSIGITFTSFFAVGIILLVRFAPNADLDTNCVLFGNLIFTPLEDSYFFLTHEIPKPLVHALLSLLLLSLACYSIHKELLLCTFHEKMAQSMGLPTRFFHYLFHALLSLAIVFAFQSVGAILVIAFLVIPASIARIFAHSFRSLLLYSFLSNLVIIPPCVLIAFQWNLNISSTIVVGEFLVFLTLYTAHYLSNRNKQIAEAAL